MVAVKPTRSQLRDGCEQDEPSRRVYLTGELAIEAGELRERHLTLLAQAV
jgi:hypothetical protein